MTRRLPRVVLEPFLALLSAAVWLSPLISNPKDFAFWRGAGFSDLLISHWPNAFFLRQSLIKWGQIPLWNPNILSGAPFAADPLSGLWYPPNWMTLVMPISLAFNLLFWFHLAWAAWGTWRLMRSEGVGWIGGWIAALSFSGTPKFLAHIGLGHLSLVCAVSWTPWVLLITRHMVRAVLMRSGGWVRWSALAGTVLGVVILADPRWILPVALLALAYSLYHVAHSRTEWENRGVRHTWGRLAMAGAIGVITALALAACLALPLFEFVRLSSRGGISTAEQAVLALPVSQILGVILPNISQPEWIVYLGVTVCFLAVVAMLVRIPGAAFWSAVVVGAWILSLGDQTPFYKLFTVIVPGANLLRVPPRMLFIASFGVAFLAGRGVDWILQDQLENLELKRARLGAVGLMAVVILLVVGIWRLSGSLSALLLWGGVLAFLTSLWALFSLAHRLPRSILALGWVLLVVVDLAWVDARLLEIHSSDTLLEERAVLARALTGEMDEGRLFSPSYSLPYGTSVQAGLELADGINPLQLKAYRDYMAVATGFSPDRYSVTLPPFPSGDPTQPWGVDLDLAMLGRLNIGYLLSEYPIESAGIYLVDMLQGVHIYRNEMARPRAWIEELSEASSVSWRSVESLEWTPNRITIHAWGPGILVLSEIVYPGWRVSMNDVDVEVQSVDGLLRGVILPAGYHKVVFTFQPWTVFLGCGITLITLLGLAVLWVRRW